MDKDSADGPSIYDGSGYYASSNRSLFSIPRYGYANMDGRPGMQKGPYRASSHRKYSLNENRYSVPPTAYEIERLYSEEHHSQEIAYVPPLASPSSRAEDTRNRKPILWEHDSLSSTGEEEDYYYNRPTRGIARHYSEEHLSHKIAYASPLTSPNSSVEDTRNRKPTQREHDSLSSNLDDEDYYYKRPTRRIARHYYDEDLLNSLNQDVDHEAWMSLDGTKGIKSTPAAVKTLSSSRSLLRKPFETNVTANELQHRTSVVVSEKADNDIRSLGGRNRIPPPLPTPPNQRKDILPAWKDTGTTTLNYEPTMSQQELPAEIIERRGSQPSQAAIIVNEGVDNPLAPDAPNYGSHRQARPETANLWRSRYPHLLVHGSNARAFSVEIGQSRHSPYEISEPLLYQPFPSEEEDRMDCPDLVALSERTSTNNSIEPTFSRTMALTASEKHDETDWCNEAYEDPTSFLVSDNASLSTADETSIIVVDAMSYGVDIPRLRASVSSSQIHSKEFNQVTASALSEGGGHMITPDESIQTTINALENEIMEDGSPSEKDDMNSNPPISSLRSVKNFYQDPGLHYRTLRIIQLKLLHSSALTISFTTDAADENNITSILHLRNTGDDLFHCLRFWSEVYSNIKPDISYLQSMNCLTQCYNIIVQDHTRESVVRVVSISFQMLETLHTLFETIIDSTTSEAQVDQHAQRSIPDCTPGDQLVQLQNMISVLMKHIGFEEDTQKTDVNLVAPSLSGKIDNLLNVLYLGLASFVLSHKGNFLDSLAKNACNLVRIGQPESQASAPCINFRKRNLACLQNFLSGPIWVFDKIPCDGTGVVRDDLFVSISVADFADLWGPVRLMYPEPYKSSNHDVQNGWVRAAQVTGGAIYQHVFSEALHPSLSAGEVLCHWYSWSDVNYDRVADLPCFDPTCQLLIGAPSSIQFGANEHCHKSKMYINSLDTFPLGTSAGKWKRDGRNFGINLGKIVGAQFGLSHKFCPGAKLRDVIIGEWLVEPAQNRRYLPELDYLSYAAILKISGCTGNARRINFHQFLCEPDVIGYIRGRFGDEYESLLHDFISFEQVWLKAPKHRDLLVRIMMKLLSRLRPTGLVDGSLQAWIIEGSLGVRCSPRWLAMLADEPPESATFAYISSECSEFSCGKPCAHVENCSLSEKVHQETLRTKVLVSPSDHLIDFFREPYRSARNQSSYVTRPGIHNQQANGSLQHQSVPESPEGKGKGKLKTVHAPLQLDDYLLQQRFQEAVEFIKPLKQTDVEIDIRPTQVRDQKLQNIEKLLGECIANTSRSFPPALRKNSGAESPTASPQTCNLAITTSQLKKEPTSAVDPLVKNHLTSGPHSLNILSAHHLQPRFFQQMLKDPWHFWNGKGQLILVDNFEPIFRLLESSSVLHAKWQQADRLDRIMNHIDHFESKCDARLIAALTQNDYDSRRYIAPRFHCLEAMRDDRHLKKHEVMLDICVT